MLGSAFWDTVLGNQSTLRSNYYKTFHEMGRKFFITYVWVTCLWEGFHLTGIKLRFHFTMNHKGLYCL